MAGLLLIGVVLEVTLLSPKESPLPESLIIETAYLNRGLWSSSRSSRELSISQYKQISSCLDNCKSIDTPAKGAIFASLRVHTMEGSIVLVRFYEGGFASVDNKLYEGVNEEKLKAFVKKLF